MLIPVKDAFGLLSLIIGLAAFIPYFWGMYKGRVRPHIFSWLINSITLGIVFIAQIQNGAGAGSWLTALNTIGCAAVVFYGYMRQVKPVPLYITKIDWVCLAVALIAIPLWVLTDSPQIAVILMTFIAFIGVIPTYRKALIFPHEEAALTYFFAGFENLFALMAMSVYSVTTSLYPTFYMIEAWMLVVLLLIMRKHQDAK